MGECPGGEGGRGENSCHLSLHGEKAPEYLTSQPGEGRGRKREAFLPIKGSEEGGYLSGEGRGEQGYLWRLPILPLLERSCSDCGRR